MHRTFLVLAALVALPIATAVSGEAKPETAYVYREQVFGGFAKHMKAAGMIVKGEIDRPGDLAKHADALAAYAGVIPSLFPAGTGPDTLPKTEALPEIWSKPDAFAEKAKAFDTAVAAFAQAARGTDADATKKAFMAVGASCGGCHDAFRKGD